MPTVALSDDQVPPADSPATKPQPVVALSDDQVPVAPSSDTAEQPNPFQRFVGRPITHAISGIVG